MVWVGGKLEPMCVDPQALVGRSIADALPAGDGAECLRKLMDASLFILRDHPVNEERQEAGQKPANCLWLWGEGRAILRPSLSERFGVREWWSPQAMFIGGSASCAGLDAVDRRPLGRSASRMRRWRSRN